MLRIPIALGVLIVGCTVAGCSAPRKTHVPHDVSLTAIDGVVHQPLQAPAKTTAFVFITTDCPIANGYAPEINRIVDEYLPRGASFYLVHVDREITMAQARTHAKDFGFTCPVLIDADHQLVKAVGATVTPEAAVFDEHRTLVYRGRIDDRYTDFGKKRLEPSRRDLRDALDAVLNEQNVSNPRTKAIGCYISSEATAQLNAEKVD